MRCQSVSWQRADIERDQHAVRADGGNFAAVAQVLWAVSYQRLVLGSKVHVGLDSAAYTLGEQLPAMLLTAVVSSGASSAVNCCVHSFSW